MFRKSLQTDRLQRFSVTFVDRKVIDIYDVLMFIDSTFKIEIDCVYLSNRLGGSPGARILRNLNLIQISNHMLNSCLAYVILKTTGKISSLVTKLGNVYLKEVIDMSPSLSVENIVKAKRASLILIREV